jgi:SAM-dependent methyltransferase
MDSPLFDLHARVEERHWWFAGRRRIVRALLERIVPPAEDRTVVDIGCGTGATIGSLTDAYRCVGIDIAREAIDRAAARYPEVRFVHGVAPDDLGEVAARADAFLLMDVLEHVADDIALFSSVVSAARPGAYFVLTVPATPSLWSEHDIRFGHFRRYTSARLAEVWARLPVHPLLVSHFNTRLYPGIRLVRAMGRLLGWTAGQEGSDLGSSPGPLNELLERLFAGERHALVRALYEGRGPAYDKGVSLVAVLRHEGAGIMARKRATAMAVNDPLHEPG